MTLILARVSRFLAAILLLLNGAAALAIEEPTYQTLVRDDAFEIRSYGPRIIAETFVLGSLSDASSAGFRRVAGYIFGGNRLSDGKSASIAMTAPVTVARSTRIEMTAPVATRADGNGYRLYFVMPSRYARAALPIPLDPNVQLREVPAITYAVIRFSGWCGEGKVADKTAALRAWIARRGLAPAGEAELARYDPPWQLPFLRRNEVMIPVLPP